MREVVRVAKRSLGRGTFLAILMGMAGVAVIAASACAPSRVAVPSVGEVRGRMPDLRGQRVMLLPVQRMAGGRHDVDAEIEFVFAARGGEVDWVFSGEVRRVLDRSPGVRATTRGLPVSMFLQSEVNRVGDPLYGQLRRLGALVNSDLVLLPVQMRRAAVNAQGDLGVEMSVALIHVRSGRVFWYGVVGGRPGPVDDFATVATAVEALAAHVLWFTR